MEWSFKRLSAWTCVISFIVAFQSGITNPLWNRAYAVGLPYWLVQLNSLVILLSVFVSNSLSEKEGFKKWIFNHYESMGIISTIMDIITVVIFQISGSYHILLLGDLVSIATVSAPLSVAQNELNCAMFSQNERAVHSKRSTKYGSGAQILSMLVGIALGAFLVGDAPGIPTNILLASQYLNCAVNAAVMVPAIIIYRAMKARVYKMWEEKVE